MNYTLAASARGGIWQRSVGESGWTNVTDPLNFPFFKISSIVVNPYNEDQLFASCSGEAAHGLESIISQIIPFSV